MNELLRVSKLVLNAQSRIVLPPADAYQVYRDRIIDLESLGGLLCGLNPGRRTIGIGVADDDDGRPSADSGDDEPDGSYNGPIFWVTAQPWTTLTQSDEAVSHLVSIYLTMINPYWRLVEEDIFLGAMRSRDLNSPLCSPALVNAMLAYGSLLSEIDEAFVHPNSLLTRGEHFHHEAIRLLAVEPESLTLPGMCAMTVLALECSLRGKDKLGFSLITRAAAVNRTLAWTSSLAPNDYVRARTSAARSVVWIAM